MCVISVGAKPVKKRKHPTGFKGVTGIDSTTNTLSDTSRTAKKGNVDKLFTKMEDCIQSLQKFMPKSIKQSTDKGGGQESIPNEEMDKMIAAALKGAKKKGITDQHEIHLLVLKKENE